MLGAARSPVPCSRIVLAPQVRAALRSTGRQPALPRGGSFEGAAPIAGTEVGLSRAWFVGGRGGRVAQRAPLRRAEGRSGGGGSGQTGTAYLAPVRKSSPVRWVGGRREEGPLRARAGVWVPRATSDPGRLELPTHRLRES